MGAFDGELAALGIYPNSNETTTKPPLYMWWQGGYIVEVYCKNPYTGRASVRAVDGMNYDVHINHLEPLTDEILASVNAGLMETLERHSKFNPYTIHARAAKRIRDLEQRLAAQKKAADALLDFAQTVAGGSSWWDDVWSEIEKELTGDEG